MKKKIIRLFAMITMFTMMVSVITSGNVYAATNIWNFSGDHYYEKRDGKWIQTNKPEEELR